MRESNKDNISNPYELITYLMDKGKLNQAFLMAEKHSNDGDDSAKKLLASMYFLGKGVGVDYDEAERLFKPLIEIDPSGEIEYYLARIHIKKQKINQETIKYLQQSISKDFLPSFCRLALMYLWGEGVTKDLDKAYSLFSSASLSGSIYASRSKASMLLVGHRGVGGVLVGLPLVIIASVKFYYLRITNRHSKKIQF